MNEGEEKRYDSIALSEDLKNRILAILDPSFSKVILEKEGSYNIVNWVALIGSAQKPVGDKIELLKELQKVNMDSESADLLNKAISMIEKALEELLHPNLADIFYCSTVKSAPDLLSNKKIDHLNSYEEMIREIQINNLFENQDENIISTNENGIYYRLDLYDADYGDIYIYLCDKSGDVIFFRRCLDAVEILECDSNVCLLNDIFSGREDIQRWTKPYPCQDSKET